MTQLSEERFIDLRFKYLCGYALTELHRFEFCDLSLKQIKAYLEQAIPDHLKTHPKLQLEIWEWVSVEKDYQDHTGKIWPLILFRYPTRLPVKEFRRNFSTLHKACQATLGCGLSYYKSGCMHECFDEGWVLAQKWVRNGVLAWSADRQGNLTRIEDVPTPGEVNQVASEDPAPQG